MINTNVTAHILVREINAYDQEGQYFVAWFHVKPSIEDLRDAIKSDSDDVLSDSHLHHILAGGGRLNTEHAWWYLKSIYSSN
jgi:hypothetical protein